VQWFLAIPHYVVLSVVGTVSFVVAVISWVAIVVTGSMPAGLAGFQAMYLRYSTRTNAYLYFLTTQYPPFDFTTSAAEPGGSETSVDLSFALESRNRLAVLFRLIMVIPAALFLMVISLVANICMILGFFAVLFTGRWPAGLRDFVVSAMRIGLRYNAYALLLTDEYPPFSLD
jgi:hypothetical protein